jgi:hypothetical protein
MALLVFPHRDWADVTDSLHCDGLPRATDRPATESGPRQLHIMGAACAWSSVRRRLARHADHRNRRPSRSRYSSVPRSRNAVIELLNSSAMAIPGPTIPSSRCRISSADWPSSGAEVSKCQNSNTFRCASTLRARSEESVQVIMAALKRYVHGNCRITDGLEPFGVNNVRSDGSCEELANHGEHVSCCRIPLVVPPPHLEDSRLAKLLSPLSYTR